MEFLVRELIVSEDEASLLLAIHLFCLLTNDKAVLKTLAVHGVGVLFSNEDGGVNILQQRLCDGSNACSKLLC